jgi:predicted nucleic acid-binding protein
LPGYFVDSSAIVKRYVKEVGSVWLSNLVDPAVGNDIYLARITSVEVISALTRRAKGGTITPADAAAAISLFKVDLSHDFEIVEITSVLVGRAIILAETPGLRGYDAVQLAAALEVNSVIVTNGLPPLTLISADAELNAAAQAEGIATDDPNAHP